MDHNSEIEPLAVPAAKAAQVIGVGMTRLYELIGAGELEAFLDGSRRMVTWRSLKARMEAKLAGPADKRHVASARKSKAA